MDALKKAYYRSFQAVFNVGVCCHGASQSPLRVRVR